MAGASCADHSADQIGNITVTAGRNINMSINATSGGLDTVVIGHGIGDSGGGNFVAEIIGNISVSTGCDFNITNTVNNEIHVGTFWNVGGQVCNISGDIDIVCARDLNITVNTATGGSSVYLGHSPHASTPNLTSNERIRVGRDLNISKTAATSGVTLGYGRLSGGTAVLNGSFELLVNRDMIINSNVTSVSGISEIAIGMFTTDTAGSSSTVVSAGRDIKWVSADQFTGIEASELPGNVFVAAGRNIEISFLAGTTSAP